MYDMEKYLKSMEDRFNQRLMEFENTMEIKLQSNMSYKIQNLKMEMQSLAENYEKLKGENMKLQGKIELLVMMVACKKGQVNDHQNAGAQVKNILEDVSNIKQAADRKFAQITQEISAIESSQNFMATTTKDLITQMQNLKYTTEEVNKTMHSMLATQINTKEDMLNEINQLAASFQRFSSTEMQKDKGAKHKKKNKKTNQQQPDERDMLITEWMQNYINDENIVTENERANDRNEETMCGTAIWAINQQKSNGQQEVEWTLECPTEKNVKANGSTNDKNSKVAVEKKEPSKELEKQKDQHPAPEPVPSKYSACPVAGCYKTRFSFASQPFLVLGTMLSVKATLFHSDAVYICLDLLSVNDRSRIDSYPYLTLTLSNESIDDDLALDQCRMRCYNKSPGSIYETFTGVRYLRRLCDLNEFYTHWVDKNRQISMYILITGPYLVAKSLHDSSQNVERINFIHACPYYL